MQSTIVNLVPMAHVADVERSSDFYALLGFKVESTFKNSAGILCWADLVSGGARIMVTRASGPIVADQQAVLFYLYTNDLIGLREKLLQKGVATSEITYPFYMEKGEIRLADPDGYVLLVGQAG